VGVQIGTLGWQDDRGHAAILEERSEGSHEFGVPVMEQRAFPQGDQPLVPAHDGVWSHHDRSHFQTSAAEGVGQHSEPVAFSVGLVQPKPVELGFEDVVFRKAVCNDPLLVTLDLPSEHGEQQLEDHGLSSGDQAGGHRVTQYATMLGRGRNIKAAEFFNTTSK
jgi:hypothetical protein